MLDKKCFQEVLDAALSRGGDFADIYVEKKRSCGISLEDNRIERVNSGIDCGAGVRVVVNGSTAYAYTNDLSLAGLLQAAQTVSRAAATAAVHRVPELKQVRPGVNFSFGCLPEEVELADKTALLEKVNAAAREAGGAAVRQVQAAYGDVTQNLQMANSEGVYAEEKRVRSRLTVQALSAEGSVMQTGYASLGALQGFELFTEDSVSSLGEGAARRAVALLQARSAPTGKMPVVMAGEAGGTMVHEACGHGLEADLVQKGVSVYAGKKGQQVAGTNITVVDDGTIPGRYGSQSFDDEGTPTRKNILIENGVLQQYMNDRLTAAQEGVALTGNGRRQSYQFKPIPRMTNTYIAPGDCKPQDIIRSVRYGLYVKRMGGGQVDTITGDFVFDVAEGYLIEDGAIGPLVRGATLIGNGPQVLNNITQVGNDLGFSLGTCGKDGQGVPVGDAQPTIMIGELTVGGTAVADTAAQPQIKRL